MKMLEWSGNPYRGGRLMETSLGPIRAELCLIDPKDLASFSNKAPRAVCRTWYLHLYPEPNYFYDGAALTTLMIYDQMPDQAKATANQVIEWAACYHSKNIEDNRRDAAGERDE